MEGEWSCYRGGQFNGGRMVMLQKWSFNGHVTQVERDGFVTEAALLNGGRLVMLQRWSSLMEGEYSCYGGGQFKGGRMVMLRRWSVTMLMVRENGHVTEVVSSMEGEWSCYRGG